MYHKIINAPELNTENLIEKNTSKEQDSVQLKTLHLKKSILAKRIEKSLKYENKIDSIIEDIKQTPLLATSVEFNPRMNRIKRLRPINNITKNLTGLLTSSSSSVINHQHVVYNFNPNNYVNIGPIWRKNVVKLLRAYFSELFCLISKPVFIFTPNKLTIHICYYKPDLQRRPSLLLQKMTVFWSKWYKSKIKINTEGRTVRALNSKLGREMFLFNKRFQYIASLLANLLKINVELEIVRLKYPFHDSEILAQLLSIYSHRSKYNPIRSAVQFGAMILSRREHRREIAEEFQANLLNPTLISRNQRVVSKLTGLRVRFGGRFPRQSLAPRRTVRLAYQGGISQSKINFIQSSTQLTKNRRSALNVKVWSSHGLLPTFSQNSTKSNK